MIYKTYNNNNICFKCQKKIADQFSVCYKCYMEDKAIVNVKIKNKEWVEGEDYIFKNGVRIWRFC